MSDREFVQALELEAVGDDVFVSRTPLTALAGTSGAGPRVFGGQLMAQVVQAATRTVVAEQRLHSLHCYFIGATRPGPPVELAVERTRDGRSVSGRRVVARQEGRVLCTVAALFHADEPGADVAAPMAVVAPPEQLAGEDQPLAWRAFDVRLLPPPEEVASLSSALRFWVRPRTPLPADPVTANCVLAYISDMHAGSGPGILSGRPAGNGLDPTSLDHAVWFHRHDSSPGWMLSDVRAVSTSGARGLVFGTVHSAAGVHLATFTQEVLLRPSR